MSLECMVGSMFSGKTTKLLKKVTKLVDVLGKKALVVNSEQDNRDPKNKASSHSSAYKGLSGKIDTLMVKKLRDVDVSQYEIIGVDEAQFFDDLELVIGWVDRGKNVVVAGLDGDFKMNSFGKIKELLPKADKFVKLSAICSLCLEEMEKNGTQITSDNLPKASFTRRIEYQDDVVIDIGGSNKYKAVCRRHHIAGFN